MRFFIEHHPYLTFFLVLFAIFATAQVLSSLTVAIISILQNRKSSRRAS